MLKRITRAFTNMRVWKKMLLGYVAVILLPSAFFISANVIQSQEKLYDEYRLNDQRSLQQSYSNLKARLKLVEGYSLLFQNNKSVMDYLLARYQTESQEIYDFLENIQPLIAFINTTDQDVEDIALYTYRKPLVPLTRQIIYVDGDPAALDSMPIDGEWLLGTDAQGERTLAFQKPIYTLQYRRKEAYLSIHLRLMPLLAQFLPADENNRLFLRMDGQYYAYAEGTLLPVEQIDDAPGRYLVSDVYLEELDALLISLTPASAVIDARGLWLLIAQLVGLFMLLSLLYYLIITSITRRLVRFTGHLGQVDLYALDEYQHAETGDEIGFLIQTYNEMIVRIRTLVDNLNLAELKKKEAAFHALQAQIRPHFMFNSLETIRMMAESEGNEEVSDALYNLGNFLRYSMQYRVHGITLATELQNIRHYLVLCKARMQDRLEYTIESGCDAEALECPSFILQPLVENAVLHATRDAHTPLHIAIRASNDAAGYRIVIQDDGVGIPADQLAALQAMINRNDFDASAESSGIGIGNIAARLASFYGGRARFAIDSVPEQGTTCTITIRGEESI